MDNLTNLDILILVVLTISSLWTVLARSLLRSAIGLALTSAILTILIYRFHSPLAAVFELSVCTGLISVLFISTISLTQPLTTVESVEHSKKRLSRFWFLPFVIVFLGIILFLTKIELNIDLPASESAKDVRQVMWDLRPLDILGQVMILLAGVFGVVVLFREMKKK